jgi:hypothetical protein
MDKTRAAAKQANAMQQLAEQLPVITDRLAAIEAQLATSPAAAILSAELAPSEPPATAAQVATLDKRVDELFISLMPAADLAERLAAIEGKLASLVGLAEQLSEIKTLLARLPQPQQRR